MKIAITGGAGFFGSQVVEALAKRGDTVYVIDDLSRGLSQNLQEVRSSKLHLARADFSDTRRAMEWVDQLRRNKTEILLHMASPMSHNPIDHIAGLELASSYLRSLAALRIPTVYISTSSANTISRSRGLPGETIRPEGLYGMTKAFMEWALNDLQAKGLVPNYVVLRPSNLYGPREVFSGHSHIHVIPNLIRKALIETGPIEVLGDGTQTRPFTYVDDGVRAVLAAIEVIRRGKTLPLALVHGPQVSIKDVMKLILAETGSKSRVKWDKSYAGIHSRELPPHDGKLLGGWKPETSIEQGIKETVTWAKAHMDRLKMADMDERPLGRALA